LNYHLFYEAILEIIYVTECKIVTIINESTENHYTKSENLVETLGWFNFTSSVHDLSNLMNIKLSSSIHDNKVLR
jgi:hypothetical protein